MADYLLTLGTLVALALVVLGIWRASQGPAKSTLRALGRAAIAISLALLVTGVVTYRLTKSRSFQMAGELVRRVETSEKVVALTFDDGPDPEYTASVLRTLESYDASATFYLVGTSCEDAPEPLRDIITAGHELGNHTYDHRRMYFLSGSAVAAEIERTDDIFRAAGYQGPITFRPPGCKRLLATPLYLEQTGRTTVTWDLEPDSLPGVAETAGSLTEYVVANARPGSIILLHPMYGDRQTTREALPRILERLSADGYRFVSVSDLLEYR